MQVKGTAGSHPAAVKMNTRPLSLGTFTLKLYLRARAAAIKTVFPMACRGPITHVAPMVMCGDPCRHSRHSQAQPTTLPTQPTPMDRGRRRRQGINPWVRVALVSATLISISLYLLAVKLHSHLQPGSSSSPMPIEPGLRQSSELRMAAKLRRLESLGLRIAG